MVYRNLRRRLFITVLPAFLENLKENDFLMNLPDRIILWVNSLPLMYVRQEVGRCHQKCVAQRLLLSWRDVL